jgi:hypothetical protein
MEFWSPTCRQNGWRWLQIPSAVYSKNRARWRPFSGTPTITPRADGTFTIGPVRAGEYVVAAVTGMSMARLFEPSARAEIAERIAKGGDRIVLVENDKHSIDLRITKLQ